MANQNKNNYRKEQRNGKGKGNSKSRGYRGSNKQRNRQVREIAETAEAIKKDEKWDVSQTNAFSWYSHFPQFTKDAGNLSFGIPLGQPVRMPSGDYVVLPGVMALHYIPTIGYSKDLTSAINRSAIRFFTYLRDVMKSAAKYDAADVMMYLMALDSCYAFWAMLRRAYGVAQLFTPVNKYYPQKLLALMGIDASVTQNLAEFRAYINRFALSLGSYTVPADFDITARHMWMNEGLYVDSDTTRAQTYLFVPLGFWKFNNTVSTGSQLEWVEWKPSANATITQHTLSDIIAIGDSLINSILNDQDTGMISGDFYAAAQKNSNFKLRAVEETPEMYGVLPVYDKRVLSQIENCNIVGGWGANYTPVISQDPSVNNGAIIFTPTFRGTLNNLFTPSNERYFNPCFTYAGQMMNMHMDSPDPEDVIEASRLMVCVDKSAAATDAVPSTGEFAPTIFGADVIADTVIGRMNETGGMETLVRYTNAVYASSNLNVATVQSLALNENFDWSPMLYIVKGAVTNTSTFADVDIDSMACDVDNFTYVSATQLAMMHEASMLSLFDIPQMGML